MVQALQGASLDERIAHLRELFVASSPESIEAYRQRLYTSWIYHDSALEGVVYTPQELNAALAPKPSREVLDDPAYDEIRQHRDAITFVRELAHKKRLNLSLDVVKKIYLVLVPDEHEGKANPKYRKDIPVQRTYLHDIIPPDKISYRLRNLIQWINAPETRRSLHVLRLAARAHHQFLEIYPFPKYSGKVARLLMNLILLHHGYPPAVLHATERQRYYEALRGPDTATSMLVHAALVSSVESAIRFLEDEKQKALVRHKLRRFAPAK